MQPLTTVVLLGLAATVASQCTGSDHPNCAAWIRNINYCTNTANAMDQRKKYCGVSCGFCNRDGSQTSAGGGTNLTACVDANDNCPTWNTRDNYCARTDYSNAIKLQASSFCCKTCRPIVFPTTTGATDGNANCDKWSKNATQAFCAQNPQSATVDTRKTFCAKTCAFEIAPVGDCFAYTAKAGVLTRGKNVTGTKAADPPVFTPTDATATAPAVDLKKVYAKKGCKITLATDAAGAPFPTSVVIEGTADKNFFDVAADNKAAASYSCVCGA